MVANIVAQQLRKKEEVGEGNTFVDRYTKGRRKPDNMLANISTNIG